MRLWLKDSERRPDPAPAKTDDRTAMLVGVVLWLIALAVVLLILPALTETETGTGTAWWLWTCIAGIALGLIGILYTHRRHG